MSGVGEPEVEWFPLPPISGLLHLVVGDGSNCELPRRGLPLALLLLRRDVRTSRAARRPRPTFPASVLLTSRPTSSSCGPRRCRLGRVGHELERFQDGCAPAC
jgi:hypothetical protein